MFSPAEPFVLPRVISLRGAGGVGSCSFIGMYNCMFLQQTCNSSSLELHQCELFESWNGFDQEWTVFVPFLLRFLPVSVLSATKNYFIQICLFLYLVCMLLDYNSHVTTTSFQKEKKKKNCIVFFFVRFVLFLNNKINKVFGLLQKKTHLLYNPGIVVFNYLTWRWKSCR